MPRPVEVPAYDTTLQVKPLRWGDARALYQNRERDVGMLAELFSTCLPVDLQPDDVAQLPAGRADTVERAILEASDMIGEGDDGEGEPTPRADDAEPAEHSVMSGPAANERAEDSLNEHTEADLIYQLHEHGYTFQSASGLLVAEIDTLMEGIDRANRRQQKEQDSQKSGSSDSGMHGNRGGAHGDALF